jgi:Protein of unknown function (DUF3617)
MPPRTFARTSRTACIALLVACSASPVLAQNFPRLQSGLWEMERASDRATNQPNKMTMCLDDTVQKQMFDMGAGAMAGMCSKHDFTFSGNRGTGDFVCNIAGSRMHSKSTMVLNGNSSYRTEIHTTYDPPFMGQTETTTVLTAHRLGACKAGQRPGDMVMPNGQTVNVRDVMGGARQPGANGPPGAPPANRPPRQDRPPTDRPPA